MKTQQKQSKKYLFNTIRLKVCLHSCSIRFKLIESREDRSNNFLLCCDHGGSFCAASLRSPEDPIAKNEREWRRQDNLSHTNTAEMPSTVKVLILFSLVPAHLNLLIETVALLLFTQTPTKFARRWEHFTNEEEQLNSIFQCYASRILFSYLSRSREILFSHNGICILCYSIYDSILVNHDARETSEKFNRYTKGIGKV